jgi:ketosteroid isomerase-like protein
MTLYESFGLSPEFSEGMSTCCYGRGGRSEVVTAAASAVGVVSSFLACAEQRDFARARELVDEHVTRTGPDGDVKQGREEYVSYLENIFATARGYRSRVRRCTASEDGRTVVVEIDESLTEPDGTELIASEAMIFDMTTHGLIGALSVYARRAEPF